MSVTYEQLDLFSIAEQNEREETRGDAKKFNDIIVGDILHVKWSNGIEWEGPYTGLTGFWDGRADAKSWRWIWATKCWSHGEERPATDYKWFVPQMESCGDI